MRRVTALAVLALLLCSSMAFGAAGDFTYGGDLRVRESIFSNNPLPNGGTMPDFNFFRIRPRLWGNYGISDNMSVQAMVTNEFRHYVDPDNETWDFPDEWFIDNLYLDINDLAGGKLDLRIGRQNLIYGTGKVILDGTPGDGSRSIYMDAIKASWSGFENMTVDLLGIYNSAENLLVINGQDRNLTNYTGQDPDLEMDELGIGVYLKHKGLSEGWPMEAYLLMKQEAEYGAAESSTINTIGLRLMPKLSDSLSGNLELAYQMGSQGDIDKSGYMLDAKVTMTVAALEQYKTKASVGLYLLSGDDPGTADDEAWTPAFSRWPQYSELYIYSFATHPGSVADWQNVMMPYVAVSAVPHAKVSSTALLGMMQAPQEDGVDGTGRGILFTWWNKFKVKEGIFREKDSLSGHLLLEAVMPGDYYADDADTADRKSVV